MSAVANRILFLLLAFFTAAAPAMGSEDLEERGPFVTGRGIERVGLLGDDITAVKNAWGEADEVEQENTRAKEKSYEYRDKGVHFTTNRFDRIQDINIRFNTGGPAQPYRSFEGVTVRGLELRAGLTSEDVFRVYGRPQTTLAPGSRGISQQWKSGRPFILYKEDGSFAACYPRTGITFHASNSGLIEECSMTKRGDLAAPEEE